MKMRLEKLQHTDPVEVGKFYLVAHILQTSTGVMIPIVPLRHVDKAFFDVAHYHIDARFIPERKMTECKYIDRREDMVKEYGDFMFTKDFRTAEVFTDDSYSEKIMWLRRKCRRTTCGLPFRNEYQLGLPNPGLFAIWMQSMVGKTCKGRKCPHYGTHMHVIDGMLECPLHGLQGDIESEIITEWRPLFKNAKPMVGKEWDILDRMFSETFSKTPTRL